mgnify:CR=1 FL=1
MTCCVMYLAVYIPKRIAIIWRVCGNCAPGKLALKAEDKKIDRYTGEEVEGKDTRQIDSCNVPVAITY